MKIVALAILLLTGCGFSSRDSQLVGQVKKVSRQTPLFCADFEWADISLGVMRNGVGSMSHEDMLVLVENDTQAATLRQAAESGKLVRLTYDVARVAWCVPEAVVKKIEVLDQ